MIYYGAQTKEKTITKPCLEAVRTNQNLKSESSCRVRCINLHSSTPEVKTTLSKSKTQDIRVTQCKKPEIVISPKIEPDTDSLTKTTVFSEYREKKAGFAAPVFSLFVTVICLVAFIIGCSVGKTPVSDTLVMLASASAGVVYDEAENETESEYYTSSAYKEFLSQSSENTQDTESLSDVSVEYLSSLPASGLKKDAVLHNFSNDAEPQPVAVTMNKKVSSDGKYYYPVTSKDLSTDNLLFLNNETPYNPDTSALLSKTPKALENLSISSEPLVLIVHTHGTESYNDCGISGYYDSSDLTRNEDITRNVVGIGEEIADILNGFGIPALHSTKMCDKDSFIKAYSVSAAEVKSYLEKYPSIRLVIDLHRDSIPDGEGGETKPVFSNAGKDTAQLMFVVGTNAAGANHPEWKENLSLALNIQSQISKDNPDVFRRINLRNASFNQQLSSGYMLLECGSFANTYAEAKSAARIFASGLAKVIKQAAL